MASATPPPGDPESWSPANKHRQSSPGRAPEGSCFPASAGGPGLPSLPGPSGVSPRRPAPATAPASRGCSRRRRRRTPPWCAQPGPVKARLSAGRGWVGERRGLPRALHSGCGGARPCPTGCPGDPARKVPGSAESGTRASESGLRRARRRGCPPRRDRAREAAPSAPRRSPHLSPGAHAGLGGARSRSLAPPPLPGTQKRLRGRGSPPHLQHGAPRAFENHPDPRSARASQQASRCRPAPPATPPPCPPARRRLVPAVRSLHPTWEPGAARAAPRLPPRPLRGACGDCAAPGSLEARARPRGNGARRLGSLPGAHAPPSPRAAPAAESL